MATIQQARATAKDYLENYDGPVSELNTTFGSPVIKQIYKRETPIFSRNALFVTFFARLIFGDSTIDPLEDAINNKVSGSAKKFEDKIVQAQTLMRENDLTDDDKCHNNLPVAYKVKITSPAYRDFIKLMITADDLLTYYDTLWMNGLVKTSNYNTMRYEVKKDLRSVVSSVRNTWIGLQKRVQQEKLEKLKEITGAADETLSTGEVAAAAVPISEKPTAKTKKTTPAPVAEAQSDLLTQEAAAVA